MLKSKMWIFCIFYVTVFTLPCMVIQKRNSKQQRKAHYASSQSFAEKSLASCIAAVATL